MKRKLSTWREKNAFEKSMIVLGLVVIFAILFFMKIMITIDKVDDLDKATLRVSERYDNEERIADVVSVTDVEQLNWLQKTMSMYYKSDSEQGGCPYDGILTLYQKNGVKKEYYFATDGCGGFITNVSSKINTLGKAKEKKVFEIFNIELN